MMKTSGPILSKVRSYDGGQAVQGDCNLGRDRTQVLLYQIGGKHEYIGVLIERLSGDKIPDDFEMYPSMLSYGSGDHFLDTQWE